VSPLLLPKSERPQQLAFPEESGKKSPFYFIRHPSSFQHTCTASTNKVISLVQPKESLDSHTQGTRLQTRKHALSFFIWPNILTRDFRLRLLEDGKVWHRNQHRSGFRLRKRCASTEFKILVTNPFLDTNSMDEMIIFTCPLDEKPVWTILHFISWPRHRLSWNLISPGPDVSRVLWLPSSSLFFFALLTVIVYVILWEKQNVHGYTIMAYSLMCSSYSSFLECLISRQCTTQSCQELWDVKFWGQSLISSSSQCFPGLQWSVWICGWPSGKIRTLVTLRGIIAST